MVMFARKKQQEAQRFLLKVVNTHCPGVTLLENRREDQRINLTVVVLVVPVVEGRLVVEEAFSATTKDFSNAGFSLVLSAPVTTEQVVVGFPSDRELTFVRGKAAHLDRMGGGFYHLGIEVLELAPLGEHPELKSLRL